MKRGKFLVVASLLAVILIIFTGCDNSSDASGSTTDNQSQISQASHSTGNSSETMNSSNNSSSDSSIATPENENKKQGGPKRDSPEGTDITNSNNTTVSLKKKYLKKLNDTKKEAESLEATDSSTYALKKAENDRWAIWDELLNEIYGVLKEQLPPVEMNQIREEQRKWIKFRDDSALEASLKYKGGTQEHLEYVAVLANLTEERCFALVEDYME